MNLAAINPISRALLKATFPTVLSRSFGEQRHQLRDHRRSGGGELPGRLRHTSHIPPGSVHGQRRPPLSTSNRLTGKFFYSDQPSRDPLFDSDAVTRHEVEETTYQRTLALTDTHVFGSSVVNEFRAGFFRNRNDTVPLVYFTNAQFGIQNPFAPGVPDLTQVG